MALDIFSYNQNYSILCKFYNGCKFKSLELINNFNIMIETVWDKSEKLYKIVKK